MSSGIEKLRAEFADIYNKLKGKYEGYIQMSDKRIEHFWTEASELPTLEELYVDTNGKKTDVNYVLEMALFDPESKQSILVRQHNDGWLHIQKNIGDAPTESYHTVTSNTPKAIIAQVWESKPNEFCNNWNVNELTMLLFAGFEKTKEKQGGKND